MITSAEKKREFILRIQELATHFGLSEKKLALKCDLTQNTFTRWKDDDGPMPGAKSINKILRATGCSKKWLIYGTGDMWQNNNSTNITGDEVIYAGRDMSAHDHATIGKSKQIPAQTDLTPDELYLLKLLNKFENKEEKIEQLISILLTDLKS